MIKNIKKYMLVLLTFIGFVFAQPEDFEYNQSRFQAFYLYIDGSIGGIPLEEGDWIAAFNGDVCVGSQAWNHEYTSLPVMGNDGTQWTVGYLADGQIPTFKVYDVSANAYYVAYSSETYPFENLGTWVVNSIDVVDDCAGTLGGIAYFDDCGVCSGGNSNHIANSNQDCQGVCFGDSYIDGCGTCVGGTTGEDPCPLDCMGIINPDDCSDILTPGCAEFDDCGICVGGTSGNTYNQEADCLGVCFGSAIYDECDVCAGDNSTCNQPIAYYQTVEMDEDSGSITINLEAFDPNGDELIYTVTTPENGLLINGNSDFSQQIYTPFENFNGSDSFTFTVSDGEWTSGIGVVTINVLSINDAPVLSDIQDQSINEDNVFVLDIVASDVDFDDLEFSASISGNGELSLEGNDLTIIPDLNFNGTITVNVSVSDGELSDSQSFVLNVIPVNDAPVLSPISNQTINEDETLVYPLEIENVDDDMVFFESSAGENFTVTFDGNDLIVVPAADWSGSGEITISALDGEYFSEQSFTLTVLPVNDAPVLDTVSDQDIDEDNTFCVALSGYDIDSSILNYSTVIDGNGETSLDGNIVCITPDLNYNGNILVDVTVSDGELIDSGSFTLTVNPVNDAPVLSAIDNQTIDEDTSLIVELSASDIDGDDLTFSATNGDSDISVDGTTLTITPPDNYNGSEVVTVTVTDGEYSDSTSFTLTVNPVNDAPEVEYITLEGQEDTNHNITLIGEDLEGDNLTYSIINNPERGIGV